MTSRTEYHGRSSGRGWRALSGALALGTVFLSAVIAARSQEAPTLPPTYTVLYAFIGADGSLPNAGLVLDKEGNLYGTTARGGASGGGVVFKLDPTGKETVLYSFTGGADGANPVAALVLDKEGNLYGTTLGGGDLSGSCSHLGGCGVVFKLDPTGKETVLHAFTLGTDGGLPEAGLVRDKEGNLYGTAGVVFEVDPASKETVLYSFTGGADGGDPEAGLVRDKEGNLYGTTTGGGDLNACFGNGCGVVFKLDPTGKETALYSFTGDTDGLGPEAGVVRDREGNLYGTTLLGGDLSGACARPFPLSPGCGVVFKLDPTGKETVLYSFTGGADGNQPSPGLGLVRDKEGNLYGTTAIGGDLSCLPPNGCGVVFKLDLTGKETVLHTFTGGADGGFPLAGLVRDKEGNLYGTTQFGGDLSAPCGGCGVVFKLTP